MGSCFLYLYIDFYRIEKAVIWKSLLQLKHSMEWDQKNSPIVWRGTRSTRTWSTSTLCRTAVLSWVTVSIWITLDRPGLYTHYSRVDNGTLRVEACSTSTICRTAVHTWWTVRIWLTFKIRKAKDTDCISVHCGAGLWQRPAALSAPTECRAASLPTSTLPVSSTLEWRQSYSTVDTIVHWCTSSVNAVNKR